MGRNIRFNFGFLASGIDKASLTGNDATEVLNLDLDRLGEGMLTPSKLFVTDPPPPQKLSTTAEIAGRAFEVGGIWMRYEGNKGVGDWVIFNSFLRDSGSSASKPNAAEAPTVSATDFRSIEMTVVNIKTQDGSAELEIRESPSVPFVQSQASQTYIFDARFDSSVPPSDDKGVIRFVTDSATAVRASTVVPIATPGWQVLENSAGQPSGLECLFPPIGVLPTEWDYQTGTTYTETFVVTNPELADGTYEYRLVTVRNVGINPEQNIMGLPSSIRSILIANRDEEGKIINSLGPKVEYPINTFLNGGQDEIWVFRRDPSTTDFVKVHTFTFAVTDDFVDSVLISELTDVVVLEGTEDESFPVINAAITNPSDEFVELFEQDNRLWARPKDRPDLLLYSRAFDWWGWSRNQVFSFEGDITGSVRMRDPTTVSGSFTRVVLTTKGIYHITGRGTLEEPYVSRLAIKDINVTQASAAVASNILYLATRTDLGVVAGSDGYDTGTYGQKVYSYDLQNLTELSVKIRGDALLDNMKDITTGLVVGRDKYVLGVNSGNGFSVLEYSSSFRGWGKLITLSDGTAATPKWTSQVYEPPVNERFTIAYARNITIEFTGIVTMTFFISGADNAADKEVSAVFDAGAAQRLKKTTRIPNLKGQRWSFTLELSSSDAKVYSLFFNQ